VFQRSRIDGISIYAVLNVTCSLAGWLIFSFAGIRAAAAAAEKNNKKKKERKIEKEERRRKEGKRRTRRNEQAKERTNERASKWKEQEKKRKKKKEKGRMDEPNELENANFTSKPMLLKILRTMFDVLKDFPQTHVKFYTRWKFLFLITTG